MAERILLVGMMGSGKTTVGRLVAGRLGWRYLDSDAEVERSTGRTVPAIFAADGEVAFRAEESRVLREAAAADGDAVVSVAGGAVLSPSNRELLARSGTVVWLRARPGTLAVRVGSGEGRPLLGDDPAAALVALGQVRDPLYASVADAVVDVDGRTAEQVADDVLAAAGRPEAAPS